MGKANRAGVDVDIADAGDWACCGRDVSGGLADEVGTAVGSDGEAAWVHRDGDG